MDLPLVRRFAIELVNQKVKYELQFARPTLSPGVMPARLRARLMSLKFLDQSKHSEPSFDKFLIGVDERSPFDRCFLQQRQFTIGPPCGTG